MCFVKQILLTPSGLFYNSLDQSVSSSRCLVSFYSKNFNRNSYIYCKQCRPWSEAAVCNILSGSTVFANYPFGGFQIKLVNS